MSRFSTAVPPLLAVTISALAFTGCGSSEDNASAGDANAKLVDVQLTNAGCSPSTIEVPSGPVTFRVNNDVSDSVTEFEVIAADNTKQGEVENVTKGKSKNFTLNLNPGSYATKCPNGATFADGVLNVSGTSTTLATDPTGAVANYKAFVQSQAQELVVRTKAFTDAVIAGDITKAKVLYPTARVPYEKIEPVAESFGDLDPDIDARADDTPIENITGFHRIEHALWTANSTDGMTPVAQKLLTDVTTLRDKVQSFDIDAAKIANGANELLGEVSQSKVTGEEERYSHTDLWDFEANVDGSQAAVASVRPLLDKSDPALGTTIDQRFAAVETALAKYKVGEGWKLYNELTPDDTKALSQAIDALAEPVSQVAAKVVTPAS